MQRLATILFTMFTLVLVAAACGGSGDDAQPVSTDDGSAARCLPGYPDCVDTDDSIAPDDAGADPLGAMCPIGVTDCVDADLGQGIDDGSAGAAGSSCLVGTEDCVDADLSGNGDSVGEPNGTDPDAVVGSGTGAAVVDGGLSVSEALSTDATGILAVKGFVVADAGGVRLCELLAESFPPQCGGARLMLDVTDVAQLNTLEPAVYTESGGVTWTDGYVTLFGELIGDVFVVS